MIRQRTLILVPETENPPCDLEAPALLSALIPPEEGSPEHAKLTEIQDLVKLVEAIKLVGTESVGDENDIPDGRIWAEGIGIGLDAESIPVDNDEVQGCDLLKYAKIVSLEGLYLIDFDRSK